MGTCGLSGAEFPLATPGGLQLGEDAREGGRRVPAPGGWSGPRPRGSALAPAPPPPEATSCASVSLACTTRNLTATES